MTVTYLYATLLSVFIAQAFSLAPPTLDTVFTVDGQGIGQVAGVDVDSTGDLFVFHRANRPWDSTTYRPFSNVLSNEARVPVAFDVILKLDPKTGRKISGFGSNFFNVPHGLTVDNNDNLWVTDTGRHQIFRFAKGQTTPNLELGVKFVPGSDQQHFCKPTGVAVSSTGVFFVADGYCNSRIIKYSSDAQVLAQWGTVGGRAGLTPYTLNIPHSIILIEEQDLVCVADRENSRALCYNAGLKNSTLTGVFNRTLVPQGNIGKVYGIYNNKAAQEVVAAGVISLTPYLSGRQTIYPPRAFIYNLKGQRQLSFANITQEMAKLGQSLIHDLCTSRDGQSYYLADLDQNKVYKYNKV
ncbi:peptidyl-alpha-hydroxyglycine alpha-amidating lyase 2 [Biomphalaria pfeifferi]|uniref:peptidylamidoglycolate lyase n=1 Tax=Biomphalaria pfeifferi TaxID=112525 RepID=A0AAD8BD81_BIOPF|nr:peptidyl-alpha-hydroxyglycine alpha-amidating lyase 2 [Biomphalaria pfeifferi]